MSAGYRPCAGCDSVGDSCWEARCPATREVSLEARLLLSIFGNEVIREALANDLREPTSPTRSESPRGNETRNG